MCNSRSSTTTVRACCYRRACDVRARERERAKNDADRIPLDLEAHAGSSRRRRATRETAHCSFSLLSERRLATCCAQGRRGRQLRGEEARLRKRWWRRRRKRRTTHDAVLHAQDVAPKAIDDLGEVAPAEQDRRGDCGRQRMRAASVLHGRGPPRGADAETRRTRDGDGDGPEAVHAEVELVDERAGRLRERGGRASARPSRGPLRGRAAHG